MAHFHAAVWLDHSEAKIFHVGAESLDERTLASPKAHTQLHRRSGPGAEAGHREEGDPHFYRDIAASLGDAEDVLIVGPSTAKLELLRYVHKHAKSLEPRIIGVETVDHPTDGQLAAYIRTYFAKVDEARRR